MEGTAYFPGPGFFLVTGLSFAALAAGWLLYRVARPHLIARL
jgi:hypothetical protein